MPQVILVTTGALSVTATNNAALSPGIPVANVLAGDLLILQVFRRASTSVPTVPPIFTLLKTMSGGGNLQNLYGRIADKTEPTGVSITWAGAGTDLHSAIVYVFRNNNRDLSKAIIFQPGIRQGIPVPAPDLLATMGNSLGVSFYIQSSDDIIQGPFTGNITNVSPNWDRTQVMTSAAGVDGAMGFHKIALPNRGDFTTGGSAVAHGGTLHGGAMIYPDDFEMDATIQGLSSIVAKPSLIVNNKALISSSNQISAKLKGSNISNVIISGNSTLIGKIEGVEDEAELITKPIHLSLKTPTGKLAMKQAHPTLKIKDSYTKLKE